MLFADDAALTAHSEEALQCLMSSFAHACREFGLTISLKKTNILGQDVCSNRRLHLGYSGRIRVPRIHHNQQSLSGHRTRREDRQGSNSDGLPEQEGVGQCCADHENQGGRL